MKWLVVACRMWKRLTRLKLCQLNWGFDSNKWLTPTRNRPAAPSGLIRCSVRTFSPMLLKRHLSLIWIKFIKHETHVKIMVVYIANITHRPPECRVSRGYNSGGIRGGLQGGWGEHLSRGLIGGPGIVFKRSEVWTELHKHNLFRHAME